MSALKSREIEERRPKADRIGCRARSSIGQLGKCNDSRKRRRAKEDREQWRGGKEERGGRVAKDGWTDETSQDVYNAERRGWTKSSSRTYAPDSLSRLSPPPRRYSFRFAACDPPRFSLPERRRLRLRLRLRLRRCSLPDQCRSRWISISVCARDIGFLTTRLSSCFISRFLRPNRTRQRESQSRRMRNS